MASPQMESLKATMKKMMAMGLVAQFDGDIDPQRLRSVVQGAQERMPTEPGISFIPCDLGGVEGEVSMPQNPRKDAVILYIHGGGLICGSAQSSRGYASLLAGEMSLPVYSLSYRLAPEHKCPAGIEDAFTAYKAVLEKHPGLPVFLIGESGGAYLCITTTMLARERGLGLPAGIIPYSPPVELGGALDRHHPKNKDFTVSPNGLSSLGKLYFTEESQYTDPVASPYYGDYRGFPPTYLVWDESESLAVDAEYLKEKLMEAGVEVIAESYPDCFHAFPTSGRGTPESAEVLKKTVGFIHEHILH